MEQTMNTSITRRHRILTAAAGTAVAAGAVLGGLALAGTASAAPGIDPSTLQKCTAFINADGTPKPDRPNACLPVDPFTEPGLTLAQRKALVNTDSGTRAGGSAQADIAALEAKFGGK
ncbi:hypothetical protein AXK58_22370 [Tsukamurella tyrosinosolvens]|nr:hypothetical protein ASU32_17620 [Tsukamurella tyrosinosolvens]KXO90801.1 hypothetical protein AXK58_22370 [Tsukamurella tyrosinosolvens]KXP06989.1 hypothetical protein AXK59_02470 [Tsukamurella tyrosinosolvens]KZL98190.1 hypothetical protein AXX05_04620 [Tsukamurella tyrosinosolvens]